MNDIAILKTNIKPNSIFPISNEDVSLLEDVVVAGYPLGKQVSSAIKTHKGVVTALAGAGDNYSNFQTDASINAELKLITIKKLPKTSLILLILQIIIWQKFKQNQMTDNY